MESLVKKYQQKFKKVKDEMCQWDELQSKLISQFSNAASIIRRLQVIEDSMNYGALTSVQSIQGVVLAKQMASLQTLLISINKSMEQFYLIVSTLQKIVRDSRQIVGVSASKTNAKQLNQRVGIKPTLAECSDGLSLLEEMHTAEYHLKLSLVSALSSLALNQSQKKIVATPIPCQDFSDLELRLSATGDLGALQQLLIDQPNIPREEVQSIYDKVFAEELL